MADTKSCSVDTHEFAAPTPWSTVGRGGLRGRRAQQAKTAAVFFFKGAPVREAPAGRGRPKRRAQVLTGGTVTRARGGELPSDVVRAAVAAAANLSELVEAHKEDFQVRFDPCKHSACCARCASRLGTYELSTRRCPLCRANIKHVVDLATSKRVKAEPFGTFPKACQDVLASRRLISAARAGRPADAEAQ